MIGGYALGYVERYRAGPLSSFEISENDQRDLCTEVKPALYVEFLKKALVIKLADDLLYLILHAGLQDPCAVDIKVFVLSHHELKFINNHLLIGASL